MTKIDFDNLPQQHETTVYVPFEGGEGCPGLAEFLDTLYRALLLDTTYVELEPPFTRCSYPQEEGVRIPHRIRVRFRHYSGGVLKSLWTMLMSYGLTVTWKHGMQGFKIGPDFEILESWGLDDGMC